MQLLLVFNQKLDIKNIVKNGEQNNKDIIYNKLNMEIFSLKIIVQDIEMDYL